MEREIKVSGPDDEEMTALGRRLIEAVAPVLQDHDGMEVVFCFKVPRGEPGVWATTVAGNIDDLGRVVILLAHVAKDLVARIPDRLVDHGEDQ